MEFSYEIVDGERLEWHVAAAFRRMKADFERAFPGITLHIGRGGGTRTAQEQIDLFLSRYRVQWFGTGPYGDVRWWKGKRYVRYSGIGTVAQPGTSNHDEGGPNGPRSTDLVDSGADAGVMTRGTVRDRWMERNAGRYGFENEGYGFKEAWHKKFVGTIGGTPTTTCAGSATTGSEYPDMFIAIVRNKDWYLVVGGKACLLGKASGARESGAPILNFPDEWAVTQLKKIVTGIA